MTLKQIKYLIVFIWDPDTRIMERYTKYLIQTIFNFSLKTHEMNR
jgi:hypothetical protein